MKVGDLVKFKENWKATMRNEEARHMRNGWVVQANNKRFSRVDKLALVTQDWEAHNNFAVMFLGETEEVDFNNEVLYSDEIMEKVQ